MYSLTIHEDAEDDLERIFSKDPDSAAFILTWLEEISADQTLLDRLSQHGFSIRASDDWVANLDVQRWIEQWNSNVNLWRLKSWELEDDGFKYRVVYAFIPKRSAYVVLGIFNRGEFNYGAHEQFTHRLLRAYEAL